MSAGPFGEQDLRFDSLGKVLDAIAGAVQEIAQLLRSNSCGEVGTTNTFGDKQLEVDVRADEIIFKRLRDTTAVATGSSEERPEEVPLGGYGFAVAFDPLDGSSIIPANFAVGAIFGIWAGDKILNRTGAEQVAAAYAVFGPRTTLVVAVPNPGASAGQVVQEYALMDESGALAWKLIRNDIHIGEEKVFAPANLRAAADNAVYRDLVSQFIMHKYTLRYTGGFVPDVHHILTKGGGIFLNPVSPSAPAKLRLLFECAPLAFIVEAAGGASSNGRSSILELQITSLDVRTPISLGSALEVQMSMGSLDMPSCRSEAG